MLELKNISISLLQNDRKIVDNFTFTLNAGDKAVIIGEEGNGKSTLLKLVQDESLVSKYCNFSGKIVKKGKTGYLPQMMPEAYSLLTVDEYFKNVNVDFYADVLVKLGISLEFVHGLQRIGTLSGGEKVKIQLARILMENPDILLLDEPTNDIDIATLQWLEGFIKRTTLPILFISHDEMLIENTANIIVHMEQLVRKTRCRITVTHAGYIEYCASRKDLFNKQLQVAKKQRCDYDKQMERWNQIYNKVDHQQNVISRSDPAGGRLLKKKMKSVKSQERRLQKQAEDFPEIPLSEECILTKFSDDICVPRSKVIFKLQLDELKVA